jgi:hypothetical protein
MSTVSTWLNKLTKNWNVLTTAASWIVVFATSVILSPNAVFSDEPSYIPWMTRLAIFIVAVIIGLSFLFVRWLNTKKHSWLWGFLALIFLISSTWTILKHADLTVSSTCYCASQRVVKGDVYKDPELITRFYPGGFDCSHLCKDFKDATGKVYPEKVWSETSINSFRRELVRSYISCFPLVAMTIISVCQAIYCHQSREKNTNTKKSSAAKKESQQQSVKKRTNETQTQEVKAS